MPAMQPHTLKRPLGAPLLMWRLPRMIADPSCPWLQSTAQYAKRGSFLLMRDQLKAKV